MFHKSSIIKQLFFRFILALLVLIPIGIILLILTHSNLRQFHWLYPSLWQTPNLIIAIAIGCVLIVFAIYAAINRRPGIFFVVLFVLFLSPFIYYAYTNPNGKDIDYLSIGQYPPHQGVDVYCNDIHLGKTPLLIPKEEFKEKVPKWETPPAQPRAEPLYPGIAYREGTSRLSASYFYYFPENPFDISKRRYSKKGRYDWEYRFLDTRYFWHFELDGCTGLVNRDIFTSAGGGGNTVYNGNPQIYFPALKPVIHTLLFDLRTHDSQPSQEWIQFVESRLNWLFYELLKYPEAQPGLMKAIEKRYRIPETVQPQDAGRIVKEVIQSVEAQKAFSIPSPESKALDRIAAAAQDILVELYPHYMKQPVTRMASRGPYNDILTLPYGDVSNGALPLEYLIRRTAPKELLDDLLYAYSQSSFGADRFSALLSHYDHDKIQDFIAYHFQNEKSGFVNPILYDFSQLRVQWAFEQLIQKDHYQFRSYFESLLNTPNINPDDIARKLAGISFSNQFSALDIRERIDCLSQIPSKEVYPFLMNMHVVEVDDYRSAVLTNLTKKANPFLDQLLLDIWAAGEKNQFNGFAKITILEALLLCQTEKTESFLKTKWREDPSIQHEILRILSRPNIYPIPIAPWLAEVNNFSDPQIQAQTAPLLAELNTPRAMSILQTWAESDNKEVKTASLQALSEYDKRIASTPDLLSGKIQPDDLLPPPVSYIWRDGEYMEAEKTSTSVP